MQTFKALQVQQTGDTFELHTVVRNVDELPAGEVLIRVQYSSLNFKDAMSAHGNRAITRTFPHTPGIDAAGVVEASTASEFAQGDEVIVTGYDLGMQTSGGFGQYIRVPAAWVIKRPQGLSLREAMMLGTAGLTAALCIEKLERAGLEPSHGEVLVTGATGGVGSIAVALLAKLGYQVTAVTGKADQHGFLKSIGAKEVLERSALAASAKPVLSERWAAVVDTVGGEPLFSAIKALKRGASAVCCGLTAGAEFNASVLPFILRGVNLLGVDSVEIPLVEKASMWDKLSVQWKLDLSALTHEVSLAELPQAIARIYAGNMVGRTLVALN